MTTVHPTGGPVCAAGAQREPSRHDRERTGLIDGLGLRAGSRVALIGVLDTQLLDAVGHARVDLVTAEPGAYADVAFFEISGLRDLWLVSHSAETIRNDGALWVLWPTCRLDLRIDDVRTTGLQAGLADVKAATVSDQLTGLKFVRRATTW